MIGVNLTGSSALATLLQYMSILQNHMEKASVRVPTVFMLFTETGNGSALLEGLAFLYAARFAHGPHR